jgi:hypothetical protein
MKGQAERMVGGRLLEVWIRGQRNKCFGVNIYKLCNMTAYTYDTNVHIQKDRENATCMVTATYATVRRLTR